MKLLILAVFCFGVNANKYQSTKTAGFRPGLANLCKKNPVEINTQCCSDNIDRDPYCTKFGTCLVDNEEKVNNKKNLVHPCVNNDIECIRSYFGKNCRCNPKQGPVMDPFCIKQYRIFFPSGNLTIVVSNFEISGLSDALIRSFTMNKKTNYLVLSIEVPVLTLYTPRMCIEFHRLGKESIVRCDQGTIIYKSVILTAELPGLPECRLDLGTIQGNVLDSMPEMTSGQNVYNSTDPTVQAAFEVISTDLPTTIKEDFTFQAEVFMAKYIESNICDFDLDMCYV